MPTSKFVAALAAAGAALCAVTACKDIPLLPKWNADWNLPLPSQAVTNPYNVVIATTVPAGTAAAVSFTKSVTVDGPIGTVLKQLDPTQPTSIVVTVLKTLPLGGSPTLQIDSSAAFSSGATITVPITLDSSKVAPTAKDSVTPNVAVPAAGIALLQAVANKNGSLYVKLAGNVHCHTSATCTVTPTDSISVKLALLATIAISK